MVRTGLASAAAAIGLLVAAPVGISVEQASRIVDRTVVCRVTGVGYPDPARFVDLFASPRLGSSSPDAGVYSNGSGADAVSASFRTGPDFDTGTGFAQLSRVSCTPTKLRVSFSTTGLRGGLTPLGARYKCEVTARILIRVRAVFKRPVTLRREKDALIARGTVARGELGVATLQRRPIAFASAEDASGKARIFVSRSRCARHS